MSSPYIGEIRMFAGNFAPVGWALCQGQLVPIAENDALFALIGTTYGGDGQNTFALPDLRGRIPIHADDIGHRQGEASGQESVQLTLQQLPSHNHGLRASTDAATAAATPADAFANTGSVNLYTNDLAAPSNAPMGTAGGSQPHDNMAPYLCVNFIISLFGIFPSAT